LGGYVDQAGHSGLSDRGYQREDIGPDRDREAGDVTDRLNRQPELWSDETYKSQSRFWGDLSAAQGRYPYLGGAWNAWNAADPVYAELGQAVWIMVHNDNIIPTPLAITANDMTKSLWLGPLESHEFTFSAFGNSPVPWKISASTAS
jgi:hypothetical protein